jgi:lysyl-tRNA synthetase class 1
VEPAKQTGCRALGAAAFFFFIRSTGANAGRWSARNSAHERAAASREIAMSEQFEYKAWPYREADKIVEKLAREEAMGIERKHDYILLETGYGPSGLPHIGTFGEVARTTWVRRALERMTGRPTRLFSFSDDMDGMRGIPDNVPHKDMLRQHLGKPLCHVPDPFGEYESFSAYANAKLCSFLDSFGFEYEFKSSQKQYEGGVFNEGLKRVLERYDVVRDIVASTLREENRDTWSPFMPICEQCGRNTTTIVTGVHVEDHTLSYTCTGTFMAKQAGGKEKIPVVGCGYQGRTGVTDGRVKVGWKVDWAMRWYVLGVDYEMYGKDLIDSAVISSKIVRALGGEPPAGLAYEWFNDEKGESISKSKGNGLTIEQWLKYGPVESLAWYIYQSPTKAKKLHFDVIPKAVDDFLADRKRFGTEAEAEQINNPVYFVEGDRLRMGAQVGYSSEITYGLLLNLVSVLNTDDRQVVWEYILRYDDKARERDEAMIDAMITSALNYYRDFVAPTKRYEAVPAKMRGALDQFVAYLKDETTAKDAESLQNACYEAGKAHGLKLNEWFLALYRQMLGQERGPRVGTFVQLYGVEASLKLIEEPRG